MVPLLAGCTAGSDGETDSNDPSGPCKRLWIPRAHLQALIRGSYAESKRTPPPITTATAEVRAGRDVFASESLDHDGCVRLPLPNPPGEYAFHVKVQEGACKWAGAKTVYREEPGVIELEIKLQTACT